MDGVVDPSLPPLSDGKSNQNPKQISLFKLIQEDFYTHESHPVQGFWVLMIHRFGNWRMGIESRWIRLPFSIIYKLLYPLTEILCGISLPYTVIVGRRVKLEHFGGMVLVAREIGNDVTIRQNTTFGISKKQQLNGRPIIGSNVDIGCGVAILGNVTIGQNSVIGANAVVVTDIPQNSLAVGVPAKVIKIVNQIKEEMKTS